MRRVLAIVVPLVVLTLTQASAIMTACQALGPKRTSSKTPDRPEDHVIPNDPLLLHKLFTMIQRLNSRSRSAQNITVGTNGQKGASSTLGAFTPQAVISHVGYAPILSNVCAMLHHPGVLDIWRNIRHKLFSPAAAPSSPKPIVQNPSAIGPHSVRNQGLYISNAFLGLSRASSIPTIRLPAPHPSQQASPMPSSSLDVDNAHHIDSTPSERIMKATDLQIVRFLGSGAGGKVYRVLDKVTGVKIALKVMPKQDRTLGMIAAMVEERFILSRLPSSPWFCRILSAWSDDLYFYIGMPCYPSDLEHEMAVSRDGKLSVERARFYFAEVIVAVTELHKLGIIHRDIKAPNVLLDRDGHIVLADFGHAKDFGLVPSDEQRLTVPYWVSRPEEGRRPEAPFITNEYRGSELEMAPEVHRMDMYSFGVDFWSAGILLYWMLYGVPPFDMDEEAGESASDLRPRILRETLPLNTPRGRDVPAVAKDFLFKMLRKRPVDRLRITLKPNCHKFIDVIDWEKLAKRQVEPPYKPTMAMSHRYTEPSPRYTGGIPYPTHHDANLFPEFDYQGPELTENLLVPTDFDLNHQTDEDAMYQELSSFVIPTHMPPHTHYIPGRSCPAAPTHSYPTLTIPEFSRHEDSHQDHLDIDDVLYAPSFRGDPILDDEDDAEIRELWNVSSYSAACLYPGPKSWFDADEVLRSPAPHFTDKFEPRHTFRGTTGSNANGSRSDISTSACSSELSSSSSSTRTSAFPPSSFTHQSGTEDQDRRGPEGSVVLGSTLGTDLPGASVGVKVKVWLSRLLGPKLIPTMDLGLIETAS